MTQEPFVGAGLLRLLYREKIKIIIVVFSVALVSALFSLLIGQYFRARTTIMPPLEDDSMNNIGALVSNLPLRALGLGTTANSSELFVTILQSRIVMEATALKFDLPKRYHKKNMEKTIRELRRHVGTQIHDDGSITLFAEAGTPWLAGKQDKEEARLLARDMANFFISQLDSVNRSLRSQRGRSTRQFIEKRYLQNMRDLRDAEEALKDFQEKHGVLSLPDQARATIEAAAELKAQMIAKEVEIGVLTRSFGENHAQVVQAKNGLRMLQQEYDNLRKPLATGKEAGKTRESDVFIQLDDMSELGIQYARLFREITLQETLLEFLLPQYEQAKIEEAKNTPSLQVLDPAVKPIRKHRPKRAMIVIFYSFLALIGSSLYFYYRDDWKRIYHTIKQSPEA